MWITGKEDQWCGRNVEAKEREGERRREDKEGGEGGREKGGIV